jgi:hypothetical protein
VPKNKFEQLLVPDKTLKALYESIDAFYYTITELKPIRKIYENVEDVRKTYQLLKGEAGNA